MSVDEHHGVVEYCRGYRDGFGQGLDKGYELGKAAAMALIRGEVANLPDAADEAPA